MPEDSRARIISAAFDCIARYGLSKTTVDDVARQARVSRATIYRYFPEGREQLIRDVVDWEASRFFESIGRELGGVTGSGNLLATIISLGARQLEQHQVIQTLLDTERDLLVNYLTVESRPLLDIMAAFLVPYLTDLGLPVETTAQEAAEYVGRMVISLISAPGSFDLTNEEVTSRLVETQVLGWADR